MQGNTLSALLSSKVNLTMETIFNLHLIFTCIPISLNPSPDYFMHCHASILSVQHTWIKFRDAAGHVATRAAINLDYCVTNALIIKVDHTCFSVWMQSSKTCVRKHVQGPELPHYRWSVTESYKTLRSATGLCPAQDERPGKYPYLEKLQAVP